MKVAIYDGKKGIFIEERPIPSIRETDVLVRNLRAGICGTDINIVKEGAVDRGIAPGSVFGHEMVSEVALVGKRVCPDIKTGMIVGVNPITAKRAGRRASLQCGGFSEYIVVEDAKLDYNLFAMDPGVSLETCALMEPLSVGRHGAFSTHPQATDHIVILGAGTIGLCAAVSLMAEDITNVCVVDIDEGRLEKAKELGAKTLNTSVTDLKNGLMEIFGESELYGRRVPDVDLFIDAAGSYVLFNEVSQLMKQGAKLSVIAVYKNEAAVSLSQIMSKELHIQGCSGYTTADIKRAASYINNKKTNIGSIVSRVYKLNDIREAFTTAIAGKNVIKVLIDLT